MMDWQEWLTSPFTTLEEVSDFIMEQENCSAEFVQARRSIAAWDIDSRTRNNAINDIVAVCAKDELLKAAMPKSALEWRHWAEKIMKLCDPGLPDNDDDDDDYDGGGIDNWKPGDDMPPYGFTRWAA